MYSERFLSSEYIAGSNPEVTKDTSKQTGAGNQNGQEHEPPQDDQDMLVQQVGAYLTHEHFTGVPIGVRS